MYRGKKNPLGNPDRLEGEFIQYVWQFKKEQLPIIKEYYQNAQNAGENAEGSTPFYYVKSKRQIRSLLEKIE